MVCLLATAGMVRAGLPLKSYSLQVTESVSLHEFSESATTISYLKKGDTLGVASYQSFVFLGESSLERKDYNAEANFEPVKTGLREIGFEFPIEDQTFTKFGIGGNGYIYFGDTALSVGMIDKSLNNTNKIGSNFFGAYLMSVKVGEGGGLNNVYDENKVEYKVMPSVILVDDDTEIQYETKDNVLYIGFKNLHVLDRDGHDRLTATYQYWVEADGSISLLVGNIVPQEEKNYFLRTVFASNATIQVINFKDNKLDPYGNFPAIVLGSASNQYNNVKYSMVPPPICAAIEDYAIDWTGKITAAPDKISFEYGFYDREKATNLLMVLSTSQDALKSELVDKKTYLNSHKINNFPVRVASSGAVQPFTDLTASTSYWLHVFPYNTNCADGPIYGMEIIQPITTSLAALAGMSVTSINGDTVNLAISAGSAKYILGVSKNAKIYDYRGQSISGLLKDGTAHETGDIIPFQYNENGISISTDIKILAVNATEATFCMTDAEPGTEYFFYAWAMNGEGQNVRYSFDYVETYDRTTTQTPAVLDFVGQEMLLDRNMPAGWSSSDVSGDKNFSVRMYSNNWDEPALVCERFYTEASTGTVSAWAVSPWFKGSGTQQTVFNVAFYTLTYSQLEGASPAFSKSVNASDSVIFQIQEKGQEEWRTIGRINSQSTWKADFNEIISDAFVPAGEYHFRIVFYQDAQTASSSDGRYFALKSLGVEKASSCLYPVDIVAPEDSMGYRSAKIMWTDPSEGWSNSYVVRYRETNDETGWYTVRANEPQVVLSGLKTGTDYVAEINTVCSAEESSLAKEVSFKTARNIVYEEKDFSTSLSELGCLALKGKPGSELKPTADGERNWFVFKDETASGEPSVVMIDKMTDAADSWLVLPVLFSGFDGKVKLTVGMSAWLDDASGAVKERKDATGIQNDTLFIYRSANRTFTAQSEIVGTVVLDNLTPQYRNLEFEFEVKAAEPNVFGFYFPGIDDNNSDNESSLGISLIKFEYTEAEFPEVKNLRFSNVTMTGFTVLWEGEAESYALLYKERGTEKYDTLYTDNTEYAIANLKEGTVYSVGVFGYYGANSTLPGPMRERSVVTSSAPSCGTPTDLVSEYDAEANTATLRWTPGESNNGNTIVYFRTADTQKYDSVVEPESTHILENLQTNVVYRWCVRAVCNSTYYSELSEEAEFDTKTVANAVQDYARGLAIRVNGRRIVVENTARHFIKTLNVYSPTGILLRTYTANTNGNMFIPTDLNQGMVIIEAVGSGTERFAVKAVIM